MQLDWLQKKINEALPAETAMKGDRIGLQIQSGQEHIKKLLITLEITEEVIEEAEKQQANCIITFHPLIFLPLTSIHNNERVGRLATKLIKKDIAVISVHTTFDSYIQGTSQILAERLGLRVEGFLVPDENYKSVGMGVVATTDSPISEMDFLQRVSDICGSPVRWCNGNKKTVEKIAIVGGSGTSFMEQAFGSGADCFITADITYHQFHLARGRLMLVDPGHYEMEQFVTFGLAKLINTILNGEVEVVINSSVTNPINYFPGTTEYINKQKKIICVNEQFNMKK